MKRFKPIVFGGEVISPHLRFDNRKLFDSAIKAWHGRRVTVTIAEEEQTRSQRAHNYLFAVVYPAMSEAAMDAGKGRITSEEWHWFMKKAHNGKVVVNPATGEEELVGQSTKRLSIEKFSAFLESVMLDGSEWFGISFPEPRVHEEYRHDVSTSAERSQPSPRA